VRGDELKISFMGTLQELLVILGNDQKLSAGYLTPVGTPSPTALQTVRALRQQFDPWVLIQNPLNVPATLMTPAWVASLAAGQDAIFLSDVGGRIDASHTPKPAYVFSS
jgi:hypothetical protein